MSEFIKLAPATLRESLEADSLGGVYRRHILRPPARPGSPGRRTGP